MSAQDKASLLQSWFQEVWVEGNLDAIPKYMAPQGKAVGILRDMSVNPDDLHDLVYMMRSALGEMWFEFPMLMEKDDWLAAMVDVNSYCAKTGDPVNAVAHIMVRYENNQMVEMYNSFDFLSFFEQLGQLPPNSLALMLSGTKIG